MSVLVARPSIVSLDVGDHWLLIDVSDRALTELNASAHAVFSAFRSGAGIDEVVADFTTSNLWAHPPTAAQVRDAIAMLRAQRLLVSASGPYRALDALFWLEAPNDPVGDAIRDALHPLAVVDTTATTAMSGRPVLVSVHRAPTNDTDMIDLTDRYEIAVDEQRILQTSTAGRTVRQTLAHVNTMAIESVPDDAVFHAAAVCVEGRRVLIAGESNAGKSTLAAQMLQRGHGYLTDEAAAVDPRGDVRPFPKSLCLDPGSHDLLADLEPEVGPSRTWDINPTMIDGAWVDDGGPVDAVILVERRAGSEPSITPLDRSSAARALFAQAFAFDPSHTAAPKIIAALARDVPIVRYVHPGGHDHVDHLVDWIVGQSRMARRSPGTRGAASIGTPRSARR